MTTGRRVYVIVSGRVQGVWFRASMRKRAEELGLTGWVRNRLDGDVEAVIEGPPHAVQELVEWCHIGSPGARVDQVRCSEEPPQGLTDFRIKG